jgi:hypothetical protein
MPSGKYVFKWTGYDSNEKVIAYQRADTIDVILSASVDREANGQYLYTYTVENPRQNKAGGWLVRIG